MPRASFSVVFRIVTHDRIRCKVEAAVRSLQSSPKPISITSAQLQVQSCLLTTGLLSSTRAEHSPSSFKLETDCSAVGGVIEKVATASFHLQSHPESKWTLTTPGCSGWTFRPSNRVTFETKPILQFVCFFLIPYVSDFRSTTPRPVASSGDLSEV